MPRVGTYEQSVAPAETTRARFETPQALRETDGIGRGLQQIGAALGNVATTMADIQNRRAETDSRAADTAYIDFANTVRTDPETGILNLKGRAAVDAYTTAEDALKKHAPEIAARLKSPLAKCLFNESAAQRRSAYMAEIDRHVAAESLVDADQVF